MASNREFLMLAHDYDPAKDDVRGWFVSEKLDGFRAWWDGGISRGLETRTVPYANLDKTVKPIATGLWTRYGNVINAPDWWLDNLPKNISLDGEVWIDRGTFQQVRSACAKHTPIDSEWKPVKFLVFDAPSYSSVFLEREVKNMNFKRNIDTDECLRFLNHHGGQSALANGRTLNMKDSQQKLSRILQDSEFADQSSKIVRLNQGTLTTDHRYLKSELDAWLESVTSKNGEGLMLRRPDSYWTPNRSRFLLKVKKLNVGDGTVLGYVAGLGKYQGMLGSLTLRTDRGTILNLSGFTDEERSFSSTRLTDWCYSNPGETVPKDIIGDGFDENFPIGASVQYYYRELSDDNIPKEARYKRPEHL